MTQNDKNQLVANFLDSCIKNTALNITDYKEKIKALPECYDIFQEGLELACKTGNTYAIKLLCEDPVLDIYTNHGMLYDHILLAIDEEQEDSLACLLCDIPLMIKSRDSTDLDYTNMCYRALYYSIENHKNNIEFLIEHIHTYTSDTFGFIHNVLEADDGQAFKTAWVEENIQALEILVKTYGLTPHEPSIEEFLKTEIKNGVEEEKQNIVTLMQVNLEKPMLEKALGSALEKDKPSINTLRLLKI